MPERIAVPSVPDGLSTEDYRERSDSNVPQPRKVIVRPCCLDCAIMRGMECVDFMYKINKT